MSTKRSWDVLTFDCYGTLIDWEGGIGGAFEAAVALGIPVAWINRKHESPSGTARPDLEFENLSQLASHLA